MAFKHPPICIVRARRLLRNPLVTLLWPLLVSIVVYYFFPAPVREAQLKLGSIIAEGAWVLEPESKSGGQHWIISLQNAGPLSITGLNVTVKGTKLAGDSVKLRVMPPVVHKFEKEGDTWHIAFSTPMAPNTRIWLQFQDSAQHTYRIVNHRLELAGESALAVWVQSDSTPVTPVTWQIRGKDLMGSSFQITGVDGPIADEEQ